MKLSTSLFGLWRETKNWVWFTVSWFHQQKRHFFPIQPHRKMLQHFEFIFSFQYPIHYATTDIFTFEALPSGTSGDLRGKNNQLYQQYFTNLCVSPHNEECLGWHLWISMYNPCYHPPLLTLKANLEYLYVTVHFSIQCQIKHVGYPWPRRWLKNSNNTLSCHQ